METICRAESRVFLKVYQTYFDESQKHRLEPDYIPYFNKDCNQYFESQIIVDLIKSGKHLDCEYFGVVSYKLRDKVGAVMKERWASIPEIANHSDSHFTPLAFETVLRSNKPDVISFQQHAPHDTVSLAERFHPGFIKAWNIICPDWKPTHLEDVFYCNYFAAKSEIYERFVLECLKPSMELMDRMPELWANSHYPHALPKNLADKWGITWYPMHPFICERLFSWWVYKNNLHCIHF